MMKLQKLIGNLSAHQPGESFRQHGDPESDILYFLGREQVRNVSVRACVCVCLMGLCVAKLRSEFPGGRVCHRLSGYDSRVAPSG